MPIKQNPALCQVRGNPVVPHFGAGDANLAGPEPWKAHHVDDVYGIRIGCFGTVEARSNAALELGDRDPALSPTVHAAGCNSLAETGIPLVVTHESVSLEELVLPWGQGQSEAVRTPTGSDARSGDI